MVCWGKIELAKKRVCQNKLLRLVGEVARSDGGAYVHKDILYVCVRGCETPQARWASSPTRRSSCFSQVLIHPQER